MEDFKKKDGEFTSAGRKLRPRRNASAAGTHRAEPAWSTREGRMSSEDKPHYGQRRGYGEDRPDVPNARTEQEHQMNRRAQFLVGTR